MSYDYPDRSWTTIELPFAVLDAFQSGVDKTEHFYVMGAESPRAYELIKEGSDIPVFYYDYEQEVAGYDQNYGGRGPFTVREDFTFEDGTLAKAGALVFFPYKMNFEAGTSALMIENI